MLAAARSPNRRRAEVLIGAFDPHDGTEPADVAVRVDLARVHRLRFARRRGRIGVAAFRVPSAGAAPTRPQPTGAQVVPIERGAATVSVVVRPHEAVLLRLLPPAALR